MYNFLKVIFAMMITSLIFTGCASKIPEKEFVLHQNTIYDMKKKDMTLEIINVKLSGDLPKEWLHLYTIDDEEIKNHLINNVNKFYNKTKNSQVYKVDVSMNFKEFIDVKGVETSIDAIYTIYNEDNNSKIINVFSNYLAVDNVTFGDIMRGATVNLVHGYVPTGEQNNKDFKYDSLEKIAYAADDTIPLTAKRMDIRRRIAYASAVRLNFAKFLQKINNIE